MRRWPLFVILTLLLGMALMVRLDVVRAEDALTAAREELASARDAMGEGDLTHARQRVDAAATAVDAARGSVDGPLWALGATLPAVGNGPRTVRRIVDVADAATLVAGRALDGADGMIGRDGELALSLTDQELDLAPIEHLADLLDDLPRQRLLTARDQLAVTGNTWVPPRLLFAREQVLRLADDSLDQLDRSLLLAEALPSFLGAEGTRRYLLALQNPAELRGTGGLIGVVALLGFDDGKVELTPPSAFLEADKDLEDAELPPVATPREFTQRYGHLDGAALLQNTNLDPDLPTVAPVVLDLWEARVGDALDGLIATDPLMLASLVEATGPLVLSDEFTDDPRIPRQLAGDDLLEAVTVDAYEVFGGRTEQRKAFLEAVALEAFTRLFDGSVDPVALGAVLGEASAGRHLQLFSRRESEQGAFRRLGIAGSLDPASEDIDLLAVTANNAAANKQDVHVGHAIDWDIHLELPEEEVAGTSVPAHRTSTVGVLVDNPLPTTGRHEWIVGSARPGEGFAGMAGEPGLNRTWWTVWLPQEGAVTAGRGSDGPVRASTDTIHGHLAVDVYLDTASRSRSSFELDLHSPVRLSSDGKVLRYHARLWRQSKAVPDDVRVTVRAPTGWRVDGTQLEGGGDGERPSTSADPRPEGPARLELSVERTHVVLEGQQTADADLTVDFVQE